MRLILILFSFILLHPSMGQRNDNYNPGKIDSLLQKAEQSNLGDVSGVYAGYHKTPVSGDSLIKFLKSFYNYDKILKGFRMIEIEDHFNNEKASLSFYYVNDSLLTIDVILYQRDSSQKSRDDYYVLSGRIRYYFLEKITYKSMGVKIRYPFYI